MVTQTVYWAQWSRRLVSTTKRRPQQPRHVHSSHGSGHLHTSFNSHSRPEGSFSARASWISGNLGIYGCTPGDYWTEGRMLPSCNLQPVTTTRSYSLLRLQVCWRYFHLSWHSNFQRRKGWLGRMGYIYIRLPC